MFYRFNSKNQFLGGSTLCPEVFDDLPGVVETRVGYTGGANPTPSYRSVCGGAPGGFYWGIPYEQCSAYGGFHKWGCPKMVGFIGKNPIKMDDLVVAPISGNLHIKHLSATL